MAKTFGCLAQVWVDPGLGQRKSKFAPRSRWAVFLGVSVESKGWEFFLPASGEISYLSRNAFFHEVLTVRDYPGRRAGRGERHPSDLQLHHFDTREVGVDPFPRLLEVPFLVPQRNIATSLGLFSDEVDVPVEEVRVESQPDQLQSSEDGLPPGPAVEQVLHAEPSVSEGGSSSGPLPSFGTGFLP